MRVQQSAFTIFSRLRPGAGPELAIDKLDSDWTSNPDRVRQELPQLHYCSLVVVRRESESYIAFEGNVDGDRDTFLRKLARSPWQAQLVAIFSFREDFSGDLERDWLADDQGPGTWYVAWRGRSAKQILEERELRERLSQHASTLPRTLSPSDIRDRLSGFVAGDARLSEIARAPLVRPSLLVRHGRRIEKAIRYAVIGLFLVVILAAPAVAASLVALAGLLAVRLRVLEKRDAHGSELRDAALLRSFWAREDRHLTNHMCGVTTIKREWPRRLILRVVLWAVGVRHLLIFNRGALAGIPTIHFARWVIRRGSRDLLFFSNYDGSNEGYLGDFIDHAGKGLNAIWSNTESYPKTRWLVRDGASDESRFKAFARNTMVPTRLWFAAYPDLSVQQIEQNARVRAGLSTATSDSEIREWLRLL